MVVQQATSYKWCAVVDWVSIGEGPIAVLLSASSLSPTTSLIPGIPKAALPGLFHPPSPTDASSALTRRRHQLHTKSRGPTCNAYYMVT